MGSPEALSRAISPMSPHVAQAHSPWPQPRGPRPARHALASLTNESPSEMSAATHRLKVQQAMKIVESAPHGKENSGSLAVPGSTPAGWGRGGERGLGWSDT